MEWPKTEVNEYEKFLWRMNPPRVTIDNAACENVTLVKVDCANRAGILLDVVQLLVDLELTIHKAYISSDGSWFMDVFHVTDSCGKKLTDETRINYIVQTVAASHQYPGRVDLQTTSDYTAIELTGSDRPGLLSEITALLTQLHCNVQSLELWTHNKRVACLIQITDKSKPGPIEDVGRLLRVKEALCSVLKGGDEDARAARTNFATYITHTERRLHQMMLADRDYDSASLGLGLSLEEDQVTVENCDEKGYSVVNIECRDRPKLLFDAICTLTDMDYVIFHGTIDSDGHKAFQEYYIRHKDGCTLNSEAERQRVIRCLKAAIKRRDSEGLRLELCTSDRVGLLSEVTRMFREHGLSVTRAEIATRDDQAVNVFYVTDAAGNPADSKVIEDLQKEIGESFLQVKKAAVLLNKGGTEEVAAARKVKFSLGNLFGRPTQVLFSLGLMKSFV